MDEFGIIDGYEQSNKEVGSDAILAELNSQEPTAISNLFGDGAKSREQKRSEIIQDFIDQNNDKVNDLSELGL